MLKITLWWRPSQKLGKAGTLGNFCPRFLNPSFGFGCRYKKNRKIFSEISKISTFSEFSICYFPNFFPKFFSFTIKVFSVYIWIYSSILYFINIAWLFYRRNLIFCVYVLIYKIHSQIILTLMMYFPHKKWQNCEF